MGYATIARVVVKYAEVHWLRTRVRVPARLNPEEGMSF
jgi:hypothetical protein